MQHLNRLPSATRQLSTDYRPWQPVPCRHAPGRHAADRRSAVPSTVSPATPMNHPTTADRFQPVPHRHASGRHSSAPHCTRLPHTRPSTVHLSHALLVSPASTAMPQSATATRRQAIGLPCVAVCTGDAGRPRAASCRCTSSCANHPAWCRHRPQPPVPVRDCVDWYNVATAPQAVTAPGVPVPTGTTTLCIGPTAHNDGTWRITANDVAPRSLKNSAAVAVAPAGTKDRRRRISPAAHRLCATSAAAAAVPTKVLAAERRL